ncbi:hypothetical protein F5B19DRAFT_492029 [Rostrohypoxylon terebratum]|nr:hypothetical protein F5B19DRAFT_492029 [Rostrohypoxylon terebratum]
MSSGFPAAYPAAATMSFYTVHHHPYLSHEEAMDIDSPMDANYPEKPLRTAATYQIPSVMAAKPSYEELEHAYNLLSQQMSTEISRLLEANKAYKAETDKAKKYLKGAMADRQRLHVDNRRLKLKISRLQESDRESGDPMIVDMDGGAEVGDANLKAEVENLNEYIKNLQTEYMELVEKCEEEKKAASAHIAEAKASAAKEATSRVVAVKLQMAKEAMVLKQEANDLQKKVDDLKQEVSGLRREVRGLREKDESRYRRFRERTMKKCRQKYNDDSEQLLRSHHLPTPSPSPPAFSSSISTTPNTPASLNPALISSPLLDSPQTPPTPTPIGKVIRVKDCASMKGAFSLAHQAHTGVRESATAALRQHGVKGSVKYLSPEVSLEAVYKEHARVRESAVNKLQELEQIPAQLKDVLGQRSYQRRTQQRAAKKEDAQMMKGAKPKRLSRQ